MKREPAVVVPDACTLPTPERPTRVAELGDMLSVVLSSDRVSPTRLDLVLPRDVAAGAAELVRREAECCSFFTFTWSTVHTGEAMLTVEVPPSQVQVLDSIEG